MKKMNEKTKETGKLVASVFLVLSFIDIVKCSITKGATLINKRGVWNKLYGVAFITISIFHVLIIDALARAATRSSKKLFPKLIINGENKEEKNEEEPVTE